KSRLYQQAQSKKCRSNNVFKSKSLTVPYPTWLHKHTQLVPYFSSTSFPQALSSITQYTKKNESLFVKKNYITIFVYGCMCVCECVCGFCACTLDCHCFKALCIHQIRTHTHTHTCTRIQRL